MTTVQGVKVVAGSNPVSPTKYVQVRLPNASVFLLSCRIRAEHAMRVVCKRLDECVSRSTATRGDRGMGRLRVRRDSLKSEPSYASIDASNACYPMSSDGPVGASLF